MTPRNPAELRHDWTQDEIEALFNLPFNDLVYKAAGIHRQYFQPNQVQVSTLMSIKTGACPEDCKYCPQSGHYNTGLSKEKLHQIEQVISQAKAAREAGASRFCMGAAWRSPTGKDMPAVLAMVREVKALGLETCMTLSAAHSEADVDQLIRAVKSLWQPLTLSGSRAGSSARPCSHPCKP